MKIVLDVTERVASLGWQTGQQREVLSFPGKKPSQVILPTIANLLNEKKESLTRLAVVTGPGSFTGIRTGIAIALGFQEALDCSVSGCDKFTLLAQVSEFDSFTVVIPSFRDQVYCADFSGQTMKTAPKQMARSEISAGPLVSPCELAERASQVVSRTFADLALDWLHRTGPTAEANLEPLYVRPADTRIGTPLIKKLLEAN